MSGILFFIFASCHPLTLLFRWILMTTLYKWLKGSAHVSILLKFLFIVIQVYHIHYNFSSDMFFLQFTFCRSIWLDTMNHSDNIDIFFYILILLTINLSKIITNYVYSTDNEETPFTIPSCCILSLLVKGELHPKPKLNIFFALSQYYYHLLKKKYFKHPET